MLSCVVAWSSSAWDGRVPGEVLLLFGGSATQNLRRGARGTGQTRVSFAEIPQISSLTLGPFTDPGSSLHHSLIPAETCTRYYKVK